MENITKKTGSSIALFAFTLGVAVMASGVAWARPHSALVDPTSFSTCGTLSGNNTIYQLTANITTASTGNCIVLSGSNDTLNLATFSITGPGVSSTGAGVKITGNTDVVEGHNSTISGFAIGVLDSGSTTFGDDINMESNGIGLEMTGGTELWTNLFVSSNTAQGVYFKSCKDECEVSDFVSESNTLDGVLVTGSDGARVDRFISSSNGGDGVHVGCTTGEGCGNKNVHVGDAPIGFSAGTAGIASNGGDGVFLDKTESGSGDFVFLVKSGSNSSGIDMHDATTTCGSNQWVENSYGTSDANGTPSPACILPSY